MKLSGYPNPVPVMYVFSCTPARVMSRLFFVSVGLVFSFVPVYIHLNRTSRRARSHIAQLVRAVELSYNGKQNTIPAPHW